MRKTYAAKLRNVLSASIASGRLADDLNELTRVELEFIAHDWEIWARDDQLAPPLLSSRPSNFHLVIPGEPSCETRDPELQPLTEQAVLGRGSSRPRKGATAAAGMTPVGVSWRVWLLLGGRGSGKTRAGAEWVRSLATAGEKNDATSPRLVDGSPQGSREAPPRIALVGKTLGDVRNVMIEGQSGLLAIHPAHERPEFSKTKCELQHVPGLLRAAPLRKLVAPRSRKLWTAQRFGFVGGKQFRDCTARPCQTPLRRLDAPRVCVTTTPRATKLLKQIIADEASVTVNLATADNATNLAPSFLAEMTRRYAGSAIGRQELLGEIVEDANDGLWRRHWIEEARVENAPEMQRIVVALDPPVTATASSDACGIVVAGLGVDKRAYVLADRTIQGRTPEIWAHAALSAYDDYEADRMVAEVNQGGDLVISVLQRFRENFPVVKVRATRGKWVRAEPVAALYAEGRVAHVGHFDALEDQMCAFGADGTMRGRSPDRADALVWAITDLLLGDTLKPSVRML